MKVTKAFTKLFKTEDNLGKPLNWEWDEDVMAFTAIGSDMTEYTLKPITGVLRTEVEPELDDSDLEDEDGEHIADYEYD